MDVSISMVGLGFALMGIGFVLILFSFRTIDSDKIKFSHELRRARKLWRILQNSNA